MEEMNYMVFNTMEQATEFIKALYANDVDSYRVDVHLYREAEDIIVVEFRQLYTDYNGCFKFVDDDEEIYKEYQLPDETYIWLPKEGDEFEEYLKTWLKEHPGYEKNEWGVWHKVQNEEGNK